MLTENVVFYPPKNVNKKILSSAFKEVVGRLKIEEKLEEIIY